MASGSSLQPFDRHPADAGALSDSAQRLAEQAAQAVDAGRVTLWAFAPATLHWDGVAAPELRAAPEPVRETAMAVSSSLSWASVAVQFWSTKVKSFNDRVDDIRAGLAAGRSRIHAEADAGGDPVTQADRAHALEALEAEARRLWWLARNVDIVAGARTAASMLEDGPHSANVAAAASVGLLPLGQSWSPLWPISRTFDRAGLSPFDIPFPLAPLGECPLDDEYVNNIVNGAANGAQLANALQLPFKDGLAQMLGGAVGNAGVNAGVNAVNEDTGICVTPFDLPQPPEPPRPPSLFEEAVDWADQALEDLAYEIENPPPWWPVPGPGRSPIR